MNPIKIKKIHSILGSLLKGKNLGLGVLSGIKTINMKAILKKGNYMERGLSNSKEEFMQEFGPMEPK